MLNPDDCPVDFGLWRAGLQTRDQDDLMRWYWAIARELPQEPTCVEVGVAYGRSLLWLAEQMIHLGRRPRALYGVDSWGRPPPPEGSGGAPPSARSSLESLVRYGSTAELQMIHLLNVTSDAAAWCIGPRTVDLVMIDGDHTYKGAAHDIADYSRLVREGGVLAGHDYDPAMWPGVVRAVDEALPHGCKHYQRMWWCRMVR